MKEKHEDVQDDVQQEILSSGVAKMVLVVEVSNTDGSSSTVSLATVDVDEKSMTVGSDELDKFDGIQLATLKAVMAMADRGVDRVLVNDAIKHTEGSK